MAFLRIDYFDSGSHVKCFVDMGGLSHIGYCDYNHNEVDGCGCNRCAGHCRGIYCCIASADDIVVFYTAGEVCID